MSLQLSKKDKQRKLEAYYKKVDEYNKLSLDELKEVFNNTKPGGVYLQALVDVTEHKLNELRANRMKETTDTVRPQTITIPIQEVVTEETINTPNTVYIERLYEPSEEIDSTNQETTE